MEASDQVRAARARIKNRMEGQHAAARGYRSDRFVDPAAAMRLLNAAVAGTPAAPGHACDTAHCQVTA